MSNYIRKMRRSSTGPIAWKRSKVRGAKLSSASFFSAFHDEPLCISIAKRVKKLFKKRLKRLNRKRALAR